jgi:hypothetical protein
MNYFLVELNFVTREQHYKLSCNSAGRRRRAAAIATGLYTGTARASVVPCVPYSQPLSVIWSATYLAINECSYGVG